LLNGCALPWTSGGFYPGGAWPFPGPPFRRPLTAIFIRLAPEVDGVILSDSDSAPVPKFLNLDPGPKVFRAMASPGCAYVLAQAKIFTSFSSLPAALCLGFLNWGALHLGGKRSQGWASMAATYS